MQIFDVTSWLVLARYRCTEETPNVNYKQLYRLKTDTRTKEAIVNRYIKMTTETSGRAVQGMQVRTGGSDADSIGDATRAFFDRADDVSQLRVR